MKHTDPHLLTKFKATKAKNGLGCTSTHEKETFLNGDLSEIFFSLVGAVRRAAITMLHAIFCSSLRILKSQISTTYVCVLNYGLKI